MSRKLLVTFFALFVLAFGGSAVVYDIANADDNEEEEREDEDERDEEDEKVGDSEKSSDDEDQTYEETVVVEPAMTIVENQVKTTFLSDRDRDGIMDGEDPHPDVAEIYIVKDDDLNGIVDTFEYGV